jgi:hypothetical protein
VGYIACAELPRGLWPDCIQRLMMNVTDINATETLKEASLEAIGYICQDIVSKIFSSIFKSKYIYTLFNYLIIKKIAKKIKEIT